MKLVLIISLMIGLVLAGCSSGGGGSSSAVQPPPMPGPGTGGTPETSIQPTPLPAERSPALRSGSYDATALYMGISDETVFESLLIGIEVDATTGTFTVLMDRPGLPAETRYLAGDEYGNHVVRTVTRPDGTKEVTSEYDAVVSAYSTPKYIQVEGARYSSYLFQERLGLSHVTLGSLVRDAWLKQGADDYRYQGRPEQIFFVHGDRTALNDIPLTGTATYSVEPGHIVFDSYGLNNAGYVFGFNQPATFTADFNRQTMGVVIDQPPTSGYDEYAGGNYYIWGLQLSGTGPLSGAGEFGIPLTGSLTSLAPDSGNTPLSVSGNMEGAFYGPGAEQMGGTFYFHTLDDSAAAAGAFVGERQ